MSHTTRDDVLRTVGEARERGVRPSLRAAHLRGADLAFARLNGADLTFANLHRADLREANLYGADLTDTDLDNANLTGAGLCDADLRGAELRGANLYGADLNGANLTGTELSGANLTNVWWHGLVIEGLHPHRILLTPTPHGWQIDIGCWSGTPDELRTLIAKDDGWPDARGDEITRRRTLLTAALHVVDAHTAAHPDVITNLEEQWRGRPT